jgi:hypothetical protein
MSDMQPAIVQETTPGLSQLQRVTSIFSAPSKTFLEIRDGKRSWWLPWAIMAVMTFVFFGVVSSRIGMKQVVENQIHMSPTQEERLAQAPPEQRALSEKISLYVTEGIFVLGPFLRLGFIALGALGLMLTINMGFGGRAKFGSIFSVWMYSSLPVLIKVVLGIAVIFAGSAPESFNIKNFAPTNIGAFLNPAETGAALYALATSIDVITIWFLLLLGIGLATVAGVKRGSGYIAVFGWWILSVLVGTGTAAIFG